MILGPDKAKLSKRHGAASVLEYRDAGYLPDALVNYLARLGWSHGDQELFTRRELVDTSTLEMWQLGCDLQPREAPLGQLPVPERHVCRHTRPTAAPSVARGELPDSRGYRVVWPRPRVRARTRKDARRAVTAARFYVTDSVEMTPKAAAQLRPDVAPMLDDLTARLTELSAWDASSIEAVFHDVVTRHGVGLGKLAQPVRAAVTGSTASPGIYEVLELLGRQKSLARLRFALAQIASVSEPSSP